MLFFYTCIFLFHWYIEANNHILMQPFFVASILHTVCRKYYFLPYLHVNLLYVILISNI